MSKANNFSIVHEQNFIRATRSTGYRSTGSAISELVDNAIQAGATRIDILIEASGIGRAKELTVAVADNGCGMDATTLRTALRFGGSTRFDDRSGQGRFGMGLPNASLSQAQRLEVYSWRKPGQFIASHIDVDEIARGEMTVIPPARRRKPPEVKVRLAKASGTLVIWERCDLLDNRRSATVAAKLHVALGRQFRYFLWNGVRIRINGDDVAPLDPLFLKMQGRECATLFGKPLAYELHVPNQPNTTSSVTVRFAELPLADWFSLSPEEKRRRGISKGAGASIVRAGREVDFGWYLFGEKRKENYDDWWRCEITYEPELDEYFGITHSKQSINPTHDLREIMCKDLEAIAHVLNGRARKTYAAIKATTPEPSPAATAASRNDKYLPRGNRRTNQGGRNGNARLTKNAPQRLNYKIQERRLNCPDFFSYQVKVNGLITITINTDHAFYDHVYVPMKEILRVENRQAIECFLLAAVRAEVSVATDGNSAFFDAFRTAWSDALEAFLDA